jgi:transcription antitermination factor NusG
MYAYCLFCQTQRCEVIAKLMEIRGVDRAFSPHIIRKQRKQGVNVERRFDLLPGYVFIYNKDRLTDYRLFYGMNGVIRRVGRREDGYELEGSDLDFAMRLLEKDGLVGTMKACRVGDEVTLEDPLFNGCQGRVVAIDYRKERAKVEFVFDRNSCSSWISLEDVKQQHRIEEEQ